MSFSLEKIKEFEKEIERRQGIDREAKEAERKKKEANKEKEEKKKRHAKWRKKGIVSYVLSLPFVFLMFQSHIYSW